ncbi:MAG: hypothetical protein D6763_06140 [Alphaproteobacteria bacterium]|nr:MAG: hypothetical protein D6763_06140 [Alphaproteobacteria bacterium]
MIATATEEPVTALHALINEAGIDPAPLFEMAADGLLACHGPAALELARAAMDMASDEGREEDVELWREVGAALIRRLAVACGVRPALVH